MPKEWYLMSRPLYLSGFENDEFNAFGQDAFQEVLESVIASDVLIYDRSIAKEPVSSRAIIQNVTSDTVNNSFVRQILCTIGTLKCGQYVKVDDAFWLVATLPDNNRVYEKAVLWKCKYTIRILSPLDGSVVEYPIYSINSTQYGTGEDNKTNISIGEGQHLVYVPHNEETVLLDDRFRFLMDRNKEDPTSYRITQVDTTSYAVGDESDGGLIEWHTVETPYNEAVDNLDLMIADYYGKAPIDDSQTGGSNDSFIVLRDADGDNKIAIGEEKEILVYRSVEGGLEPLSDYTVSLLSTDIPVKIESQTDGVVVISVPDDRKFVGKSFGLQIFCGNLDAESTITIKIVNW